MQLPGETLLVRLWETVAEKGIGGLLKPWQIRRVGLANAEVKRQELLILAQAESDLAEIQARRSRFHPHSGIRLTYEPSKLEYSTHLVEEPVTLVQAASDQVVQEQLRKDINLTRTLNYSERILENDTSPPPEEKPTDEWLYRWRDYASDVSTEELQVLWARLLSGEVKTPGSFSLRTLDFVRNLSSNEASLASKVLSLTVWNWIFAGLDRDKKLKPYGISFHDLLVAQSMGLITSADGFGLTFTMNGNPDSEVVGNIVYGDKVLHITKSEGEKKVEIPVFSVTPLGLQIRALASPTYDYDYFKDLGKHIVNTGAKVKIGNFVPTGDSSINMYNLTDIEG